MYISKGERERERDGLFNRMIDAYMHGEKGREQICISKFMYVHWNRIKLCYCLYVFQIDIEQL